MVHSKRCSMNILTMEAAVASAEIGVVGVDSVGVGEIDEEVEGVREGEGEEQHREESMT